MRQGDDLRETLLRERCMVIAVGEDGLAFMPKPGLRVIASWGSGWDHVSVSRQKRCPTWDEMERVRQIVTLPGEVWVQYGMPADRHINIHGYCLHWWRPQDVAVPTPPAQMV